MRIDCHYCGTRDLTEFSYQGDATIKRPAPDSENIAAWNKFVYDRENPAGDHKEYWQHSGGCRQTLIIERSTLTHKIQTATTAWRAK